MIESFEYKGRWRRPNEEVSYDGRLSYSPDKGSVLEIFGTYNSGITDRDSQEIILGETSEGPVTLINCIYGSVSHNFESNVTIGTYHATFIIVGKYFQKREDVLFQSVTFELFNLFEWISKSGLEYDFPRTNKYSINYLKPNEKEFIYSSMCKGKIEFHSPVTSYSKNNTLEIKEECTITFDYDKQKNFTDILLDINSFTGFITLSTFEQCYPLSIIFNDEKNGAKKAKQIRCIYHNSNYGSEYKIQNTSRHLIRYSEIENEFSDLIHNWNEKYNELRPVFSLLLYTFKDKSKFDEDKFMDVARAIETFHRRTQNNSRISDDSFKSKIDRILDAVSSEDKAWLGEKLKYANEPSLRVRLIGLLKDYSTEFLKDEILDVNSFCNDVLNSRNYYTHYSAELESKTLKSKELYELNQKLLALLISCVLRYIGVNELIVDQGLERVMK